MEVETAEEAPPPPLPRKEAADTSQDSGVDSGAVTDDGDARRPEAIDGTAKKHSQEGSHYSYIDGGLELRPPPDNLDLVILTMERVEGMNKVLGETEEEIVALGFELSMLADSGSRVASPLDCFTTEVTRYQDPTCTCSYNLPCYYSYCCSCFFPCLSFYSCITPAQAHHFLNSLFRPLALVILLLL